ncbi:MAG TPA: di-heme oxidoredictase family protein [Vicinamibacterales bacterium]|nr:di-heme oxidoredictase family protein [Vicinamibacterales bacterium]
MLSIFTIAGRIDAPGCNLQQPDFDSERNNLSFRIPTPVFGDGLIENIPESTILANRDANKGQKNALGISGQENRSGQDGMITRFGWKAQVESAMMFSGQAYNVEMGVTNELFPNERDQAKKCQFSNLPEDHPDFEGGVSGVQNFTNFMRLVAPALPAADTPSIVRGRNQFDKIGCTLCHTPSMKTGPSDIVALANRPVNLYSDLLLHKMGSGLEDRITQGRAGEQEFRTAPLWGLGQRIFFLHDGRTRNLVDAVRAHKSAGSEANEVINLFEQLSSSLKQDLLNFLRSL